MAAIIKSLLDQDLYKLTMHQLIFHRYAKKLTKYRFKCRKPTLVPLSVFKAQIEAELDELCSLKFVQDELSYLATLGYFASDYLEYLSGFQLKRELITVREDADEIGGLTIEVAGSWTDAILFEIFVLAIVNEIYFRNTSDQNEAHREGEARLQAKISLIQQKLANGELARKTAYSLIDFGTRRRYSREWQYRVVSQLKEKVPSVFKGTSNVYLAMTLGLTPIGTMAHEYLQGFQALTPNLRDFQKKALEVWLDEYKDKLGIALTDVIGIEAFLRDFDTNLTHLYRGVRHDSGDPIWWANKVLAHYAKHNIDPMTKVLTFSDGLTVAKSLAIFNELADTTQTAYGIGTSLTNDLGLVPLEIVMKIVECDGKPVAKISDAPGKGMCKDAAFVQHLRAVFAGQDDSVLV